MRITLNGEAHELPDATTAEDLLRDLGQLRPGIAVAVNLEVVPRSLWSSTVLNPEDRVDVVEAVGGG
jgi:sulfur carrier protein